MSRFALSGVVLAVASVFAASLALQARPALACSRAPFFAAYVPDAAAQSQVVAMGTFTEHTERAATFRVDEPLRGAGAGDTFDVDNRTTYTAFACSPYDEPFHEGFRFRTGDQFVLMLEKEVDGLWQVSFGSWAAWRLPDDELQPLSWHDNGYDPGFQPLSELRTEVQANLAVLNSDPGFESRTPCNPSRELTDRMRAATVIVIADIEEGIDVQQARVVEVIAGSLDAEDITVNFRVRRSYEICDLVLEPPAQEARYTPSGRHVLFLRPDEFGVGEYRPALWGSAAVQTNETWVTYGFPSLRDIRTAAGAPPAPAPTSASLAPQGAGGNASEVEHAGRDDGASWPWILLVGALALLAFSGGGYLFVVRRGR